jgi:hypothetical protein
LLTETAKREAALQPGLLAPLVEANLEKSLAMPRENRLVAMLRKKPAAAKLHLAEEELDLPQTEQHSVLVRLLAARAKLQDLQRYRAERFALPLARARQYSQCPGPCASSREIPVARKCNRAARYDGRPIFARYRPPNNRRALVGCDNKCSRSQRKHVHHAQTSPIVGLDRYRCLPRRTAD